MQAKENQTSSIQPVETQSHSTLKAVPPLCPIHREMDKRNALVVQYGNDCIACSLNERVELLQVLAPHVPIDGWVDPVGFLRLKLATSTDIATALEVLQQEIDFHKDGAPKITMPHPKYAEGFIRGLEQAKELIVKVAKTEGEKSHA